MIIFATGFLLKENYSIFMDYNKEIREFADSPDYGTYYGTFHGLAPNFCTFLGPMTGLGHNSIIFMIGMNRAPRDGHFCPSQNFKDRPSSSQKFQGPPVPIPV